jgi:hypothetical protein
MLDKFLIHVGSFALSKLLLLMVAELVAVGWNDSWLSAGKCGD